MDDSLDLIIKKVLREQSVIGAPNQGIINTNYEWDKKMLKYSCIPFILRPHAIELIEKGVDKKLLKAAIGVIGRETDYGTSLRYFAKTFGRFIADIMKSDPIHPYISQQGKKLRDKLGSSEGIAQMKPDTAKRFGVDAKTVEGALVGAYRYLKNSYKIAKSVGYDSTSPSSNYGKGTGDAALDISIVGYNQGEGAIKKYCETSDPKKKNDCKNAGKTVKLKFGPEVKVYNKPVKNYLPYYKSSNKHHYTGLLTSWGYVKEVSEKMKSLSCF